MWLGTRITSCHMQCGWFTLVSLWVLLYGFTCLSMFGWLHSIFLLLSFIPYYKLPLMFIILHSRFTFCVSPLGCSLRTVTWIVIQFDYMLHVFPKKGTCNENILCVRVLNKSCTCKKKLLCVHMSRTKGVLATNISCGCTCLVPKVYLQRQYTVCARVSYQRCTCNENLLWVHVVLYQRCTCNKNILWVLVVLYQRCTCNKNILCVHVCRT